MDEVRKRNCVTEVKKCKISLTNCYAPVFTKGVKEKKKFINNKQTTYRFITILPARTLFIDRDFCQNSFYNIRRAHIICLGFVVKNDPVVHYIQSNFLDILW